MRQPPRWCALALALALPLVGGSYFEHGRQQQELELGSGDEDCRMRDDDTDGARGPRPAPPEDRGSLRGPRARRETTHSCDAMRLRSAPHRSNRRPDVPPARSLPTLCPTGYCTSLATSPSLASAVSPPHAPHACVR